MPFINVNYQFSTQPQAQTKYYWDFSYMKLRPVSSGSIREVLEACFNTKLEALKYASQEYYIMVNKYLCAATQFFNLKQSYLNLARKSFDNAKIVQQEIDKLKKELACITGGTTRVES